MWNHFSPCNFLVGPEKNILGKYCPFLLYLFFLLIDESHIYMLKCTPNVDFAFFFSFFLRPAQRTDLSTVWMRAQINPCSH